MTNPETIENVKAKGFIALPDGSFAKLKRRARADGSSGASKASPGASSAQPASSKRVRQSGKPLMNRLETGFLTQLRNLHVGQDVTIRSQSLTFRLCNGVTLRPDFVVFLAGQRPVCEEVKGKHAWEDSLIKLKMAAQEWPEFEWRLNWRENGMWHMQTILP